MTQPPHASGSRSVPEMEDHLSQARQRFERAWQLALAGGAHPDLEAYLVGPEGEVPGLRAELERIEQSYRQGMREAATLEGPRVGGNKDTSPVVPIRTI